MSKRSLVFTVSLLALTTYPAPVHGTGYLSTSATCDDNGQITLTWSWYENGTPVDRPDWVGYDVQRRSVADCGAFTRVNDTTFPRTVGANHTHTYVEAAPATETTFEYRVIYVDANHQPVTMIMPDRDPFSVEQAWVSSPDRSAPATEGLLSDWGWALGVDPCPQTCYQSLYFEDPTMVAELRPLVGTGKSVRLFGRIGCGSVEGCYVTVSRYEVSDCIATPTRRSTWGALKLLYR
jgi:hypothetical protein